MNPRVYIRVDGSETIGLGHLIRCMALGEMLKDDFELSFVCKEVPETIKNDLVESGFLVQIIEREEELLASLTGTEVVVIDHYGLDVDYQKKIKDKGNQLVIIDDLYEKEFVADLIINHAPGVTVYDYKATPVTQFALGLEFVLLRPPFLRKERRETTSKPKEKILICFGGSDFKNLTRQTLLTVLGFDGIKEIVVVTGTAYQHQEELKLLGDQTRNVQFYQNIGAHKMAELLSESDIAIVPSSGILLEALAVGNNIISGMYVDNQKYVFENLKKSGAFYSAEDFSRGKLETAINDCLVTTESHPRIIDGRSGHRILKIFKQMAIEREINLREAKISDLSLTYRWATDKAVRAFSFNKNEIIFADHSRWFLSRVEDNRCLYLIAELDGTEIGSVRFDLTGEEALISYLLDPKFHRRGLSVPLLRKGLVWLLGENREQVRKIIGFVLPENIASCKTFERFGFSRTLKGENFKYTLSIN